MAKKTPSVRLTVSISPEVNERLEKEARYLATTKNAVVVAWITDRIRSMDNLQLTKDEMMKRMTSPEVLNALLPEVVAMWEKHGLQTNLDLGKEEES